MFHQVGQTYYLITATQPKSTFQRWRPNLRSEVLLFQAIVYNKVLAYFSTLNTSKPKFPKISVEKPLKFL